VKVDNLDNIKNSLGNAALLSNAQVFPIHIFDKAAHYFNLYDAANCKGVIPLREQNLQKQILKDVISNFTRDYPELGSMVNMTFNDWQQVFYFADAFASGYFDKREYWQINNITYPLDALYNRSLAILQVDMFESIFGDPGQMIAINTMSPIVNRLYAYFDNVIGNDNNGTVNKDPKMVLYSAHDSNIGALMIYFNTALNLNLTYPYIQFASNFLINFNLSDSATKPYSSKDYTLDISYNGASIYTDTYQTFRQLSEKIMINASQTAAFCEFTTGTQPSGNSNDDALYFFAIAVLMVIAVILIVSIIVVIIKRKRTPDGGYQTV